jgi:hypothetical protein
MMEGVCGQVDERRGLNTGKSSDVTGLVAGNAEKVERAILKIVQCCKTYKI